MIFEYIIIVLLFAVIVYILVLSGKLLRQNLALKRELNNQSLDYHLDKVSAMGYEFTLKKGKGTKVATHSTSKSKSSNSSKDKKRKGKSKTFDDIMPKK